MSTQTKKQSPQAQDTLLEQLRGMGRGVAKTVIHDVVGGVAQDALASLFGTPRAGDLEPGKKIEFGQPKDKPDRQENPFIIPQRREFHSPVYDETLNKIRSQERLVAQKIEEIRIELKALIIALKAVDKEIKHAVEENIIDPGVYHLNFLDRIKSILKVLRQNLSDSASWLAVMRSRKKQRTYWSLYKKKGTEFGLNHERVIATQVG